MSAGKVLSFMDTPKLCKFQSFSSQKARGLVPSAIFTKPNSGSFHKLPSHCFALTTCETCLI
ncbi:unnamed protein product [Prunus armeniaca]|uniref:Uncharacterized protein n=1 Tax=Prunus armeniaca TaxID=36596 RepID=A0A6J5Y574_PRUAR|nr:unnamed protein product [Prunus armeniaca]